MAMTLSDVQQFYGQVLQTKRIGEVKINETLTNKRFPSISIYLPEFAETITLSMDEFQNEIVLKGGEKQ